jgi:hypothetical protein
MRSARLGALDHLGVLQEGQHVLDRLRRAFVAKPLSGPGDHAVIHWVLALVPTSIILDGVMS